ncbi:S-layer homology domain-containing protein [Aneurinibacillus migulanus]|uniref:S-layer homology domain-containing protein n=1 Tax=Aneurinibacillus migulanus TaxID=47500 RepID=A0A0D1XZD1_ANEMI|nr:S-layer homology domain-containing protein [Aneurinibacillus migulanus]KIV52412.1 hypothetical protein TS65_23645 [Aneurinibacillus migulanus]KON94587.1 hypothetical protein AF333_02825 [Aneurinibacillus migulanus]MED0892625.1 S-layer homology domain-containing protein [Aneurinibacillus migulanus]MED1614961.1 S-layer homology domain-containing protein [Aneurinibacillus migulanus]SDI47079.1 S-layer homology domain-containing protein [Aneurinibacillus migulanus]
MKATFNKVLTTTAVLSMVLTPGAVWAADDTATSATPTKPAVTEQQKTPAFPDLNTAASWAREQITQAKEMGWIGGYPDGKFYPLNNLTRREAAIIMSGALELKLPDKTVSSYPDVKVWGIKEIEAVKEAGLMVGKEEGKFNPDDKITRQELAIILVKAAKISTEGKGDNLTIADADKVWPDAKPYVQVAMDSKLMIGYNNHFNPRDTATRQEMAVMAVNLANVLKDNNTPSEQAGTVAGVTADTLTLNDQSYKLTDAVKGIFNEKNAAALKDAQVKVEVDGGKNVTKVKGLELTAAGQAPEEGKPEFSGNLTLDGNQAIVEGDVAVRANYISLHNLTVKGNLTVAKEVQNDFEAKSVTVEGNTLIEGGDTNTVVFENSKLKGVQVAKENVKVNFKGNSSIETVEVAKNAELAADQGISLPKVTVKDGVNALKVNVMIDELTLPEKVKVEEIISNYEEAKNWIGKVNGEAHAYNVYKFVTEGVPTSYEARELLSQAPADGKTAAEVFAGMQPVKVSLAVDKDNAHAYEGHVRIQPSDVEGVQLWAQDTEGKWWDINKTGWGPAEGFKLNLDLKTDVYVVAQEGTHTIPLKLEDVDKQYGAANNVIVQTNLELKAEPKAEKPADNQDAK